MLAKGRRWTMLLAVTLVLGFRVAEEPGYAALEGVITGPQGRPLPSVLFLVEGLDRPLELRTDAAGRYSTRVPTATDVVIRVLPAPETRLVPAVVRLRADKSTRRNVQLDEGNLLSGTVLLPDGQPYTSTNHLIAQPFTVTPLEGAAAALESPQGTFSLVLPPDVYLLRLKEHPGAYYCPWVRVDLRGGDVTGYSLMLLAAPPSPVPLAPPQAARIHVGPPDSLGNAVVTGEPGAVEPLTMVYLCALETGRPGNTLGEADGSFRQMIAAPRGSAVMVKHGYVPFETRLLVCPEHGGTGAGDLSAVNPWPATIVQTQPVDTDPGDGIAFHVSLGLKPKEGRGVWSIEGTLGPVREIPGRRVLPIEGKLRFASSAITASTDLGAFQLGVDVTLRRLSWQDGRPALPHQSFMSDLMTPTGLPIERSNPATGPVRQQFQAGELRRVPGDEHALETQLALTLTLPITLQAGFYQPVLTVPGVGAVPVETSACDVRHNFYYRWYEEVWLPALRIGDPAPPRLTWMLLADELSSGTRGTVAREEQQGFGLSNHIITAAERFIIERDDPQTGQPKRYRLEPYLPAISWTDRGIPNAPLIPFQFPSGELYVRVDRPSGATDVLGPLPFAQSVSRSPCDLDGRVYEFGTGNVGDIYQLTTLDDRFAYQFVEYGHHVIRMVGQVRDIWGNMWQGGGTYDVYVARTLTFDAGSVPASPYVVGDELNPKIQVYPAVPADVQLRLQLYPDSNAARVMTLTVAGRANRYGFFDGRSAQRLRFEVPGEYRIDLTGTYAAADGTLWMGSVTWANVVQPPSPQMIAHGMRGLDTQSDINSRLPWFFHRTQSVTGTTHTHYPYFSGDIFWGFMDDAPWGGDAIKPEGTIQDLDRRVSPLLRERTGLTTGEVPAPAVFDQLTAIGEVPLFISTDAGVDPIVAPDRVDRWGYAYRSSERPGLHVHDDVCGYGMPAGYWRFDDNYGHQISSGTLGDLPNDIKWQYVGAVFRDAAHNLFRYAGYASLWVLAPDDDPLGARTMPPFQGAAGGPSGGPIMTLKGEAIDLFFLPMGVQPGSVLFVGQTASFSGQVGPPLDSRLTVTITSPSGIVHRVQGRADSVGYFYDPRADATVDEPGRWTVDVSVVHDRAYAPTGVVPTQHNRGDVLGSANGRYEFYVVAPEEPALYVAAPADGFLTTGISLVLPVAIYGALPREWADAEVRYTIQMPGFILKQGQTTPQNGSYRFDYDPESLVKDFPNLDLQARDLRRPGLADLVTISVLASGRDAGGNRRHRASVVNLLAEDVKKTPSEPEHRVLRLYLPVVVKRSG